MFCFQCEQTANYKACTASGVCGKSDVTAKAQDDLTGALISLAMSGSNDYDLFKGISVQPGRTSKGNSRMYPVHFSSRQIA